MPVECPPSGCSLTSSSHTIIVIVIVIIIIAVVAVKVKEKVSARVQTQLLPPPLLCAKGQSPKRARLM